MKRAIGIVKTSLFVAFSALIWTTCDVGLGEAVDTMAPTVSVSNPIASSVCAGPVTISGSCADDKGISAVEVVVKNTSTGKKYKFNGKVKNSSSWSVKINDIIKDSGYPLPDGSYTADATAIDIFGRTSGTSSTAFDIDNTPPVFCVTSPASLDISKPRKYGRSVTISGEIADDHDIAKMDIRVFRDNGEEITDKLAKTEFKDFETAGGTTVYIAKYFSDPTKISADDMPLYNNYMAMYGNTALKNDVYLYIVPTLTDIAGNTSEVCYLSSNLKNLAAELCEVDIAADSLQTAQLMKILNGTYSLTEFDDDKKAKVLSLLNGTYELQSGQAAYYSQYPKDDAAKKGPLAACVNSDNAPTYDFNGYSLESDFTEVNTGGTISISVKAGLDDWGVYPNKLVVRLDRCDSSGRIYGDGDPEKETYISSETEGFEITNASGDSVSGISTPVTAQSYYVTLPKLSSSQYYIITATGEDEDGNPLCPLNGLENGYGFQVASNGVATKVTFEDKYYIKGSEVLTDGSAAVTLNVNDGTDTINDGTDGHYVKVTRKLYDGHIASKGYIGNKTPISVIAEEEFKGSAQIVKKGNNEYTVNVPINKFTASKVQGGNYTLALEVKAKNSMVETEATFIVWIDDAKPVITITAPKTGDKIYEGKVKKDAGKLYYTAYGKWSDKDGAGTSALWYSVTDTGTDAPAISGNADDGWTITGNSDGQGGNFAWHILPDAKQSETETKWDINLDAVESTGNFIKMIAVDALGNVSSVVKEDNITYDFGAPTVTFESEPGASSDPVKASAYYNYDSPSAGGKFEFVFKADDSLALDAANPFVVTAEKYNTTEKKYEAVARDSNGFNYALGAAAGDNKSRTLTVYLAHDAAGKTSDDKTSEGKWKVTVTAKDACGRLSVASSSFETMVDCVKPQLVDYEPATATTSAKPIVIKGDQTLDKWFKDETLNVSGRFTEATSGVEKIYYFLETPSMQKNGGYTVPTDLTVKSDTPIVESHRAATQVSTSANSGSAAAYTITVEGFEEKIVYTPEESTTQVECYDNLYIQAIDIAGNKSEKIGPFQVKEDKTAPVFEAKYYTYDGSTMVETGGSAMTNGSKDMTLYGDVSDALSGIQSLSFKIGDKELKETTSTETHDYTIAYSESACSTSADYKDATYDSLANLDVTKIKSWKAVIKNTALTSGELCANISDCAENSTGYQRALILDVDNEAPEIKSISPATAKPIYGSVTFRGSVTDNSDLASVKIEYSATNTSSSVWTLLTPAITDSKMYNWSATAEGEKAISKASGGSYKMLGYGDTLYAGSPKDLYIRVTALDKAGNEAQEIYQYSIAPELDRPKIKIIEALNEMTSADEHYVWIKKRSKITGQISDDNGIESLEAAFEIYDKDAGAFVPTSPAPELNLEDNGSFTISNLPDGKQRITFTAKDKAGTTFTASDGSAVNYVAPYVFGSGDNPTIFGDETDGKGDTLIYVKVDNKEPRTKGEKYSYYDKKTSAASDWTDTLMTLGGNRSKLNVQIKAFDEFGIGSVKFTMDAKKQDGTDYKISKAGTIGTAADTEGYVTCEISDIDMSDVMSGTWPAKITVTDNAGLSNVSEPINENITVDNTKPVIKITAPVTTLSKAIVGEAIAGGSVSESSKMYYGLSYEHPAGTIPEPADSDSSEPGHYRLIDSSLSWNVYFDGDRVALNHDRLLKEYLIEKSKGGLGITTEAAINSGSYDTTTELYLWVKAIDSVGNESVEKTVIHVDPQGDRPTAQIKGPSTNGTTSGGKIRVNGSASDNKEVKAVFVQIISAKTEGGGSFPGDGKSSATEFTLKAADLNYLASVKDKSGNAVYKIYKMATFNPDDSDTWEAWPSSGGTDSDAKNYGALTNLSAGGKSWSLYINEHSEFANSGSGSGANSICIRAFAVDEKKDGKPEANVSLAEPDDTDRQMYINENAPIITDLHVRTYSGAVTIDADPASSTPYVDDLFVKDETWLSFVLKDSVGISSLAVGLDKGRAGDASAKAKDVTLPENKGDTSGSEATGIICKMTKKKGEGAGFDDEDEIKVLVKLSTDSGIGTQYIHVDCGNASAPSSIHTTGKYAVKFDNVAPEIAGVDDKSYEINPKVQQSNGWYSFGSKVSEPFKGGTANQSGFGRVAFYFIRRGASKTYIYDPMAKKGLSAIELDNGLKYSEGLYWKTITVNSRSGNTLTLASGDNHIHNYGLVKVNGTIYRIESASGATVTVEVAGGELEGDVSSADFAYGNVVDHQVTEKYYDPVTTSAPDYSYGYKSADGDDGDKMIESVDNDGTNWKWSASVYSKNIPDGPIELHYVAFDKAGNYAKGIVGNVDEATYKGYTTKDAKDAAKTDPDAPVSVYAYAKTDGSTIYFDKDVAAFVSNNAPRLTNLYAGTDLNGNNTVDESEITSKAYAVSLDGWEEAKDSLTLGKAAEGDKSAQAAFTAKGKTVIRPEIIGGNGALYYEYKISGKYTKAGETDPTSYTISGQRASAFMASDTGAAGSREDQAASVYKDITLHVGDFSELKHDGEGATEKGIKDCGVSDPVTLELTFWDSTEGTTYFTDSQNASATVYMAVDVGGQGSPSVGIDPLYWNGLKDNSIYDSSSASTYADLKGHIELSDELPSAFKDTGAEYTDPKNTTVKYDAKEMDKDAKLSGVIVLTGTVKDEKMLSKVYMSIDGMETALNTVKTSAADSANCKVDGTAVTAYPLAEYTPATTSVAAHWTANISKLDELGIDFEIVDGGITEKDGHSATWKMVWDTSRISGIAGFDKKINVFACSQKSEAASGEGEGYTEEGIDGVKKYKAPEFKDNNFSASGAEKDSYLKVDVVPYITGLETTMTEKGAGYGRTSTGRYPVYFYKNSTQDSGAMKPGETEGKDAGFTINGFNLAAKNVSVTKKVSDSGANDITASIVYAHNVSGVYTLNNINNDDAKGDYESSVAKADWAKKTNATYNDWKNYCNRQPNKENNLLLTDDVAIDVWQINNMAAVPLRGIANDVTMKINEESKMLNFAFVNGPLNLAMANGTTNSYQTWARSYDFCKSATLALDSSGWAYGTIAGGDTGDNYADAFGLYVSNWGTGYLSTGTDDKSTHGTQQSDQGQRRLESVGQTGSKNMTISSDGKTYTNTASGDNNQTDQWRIVSPSAAATYNKSGTTETRNVYLAYYDEMNDEIRFKVGKSVPTAYKNFGDFVDDFTRADRVYHYRNTQIVAQANSPVAKPGPYVSIAARRGDDGKDVVVMVWHDPENRCMWYSYNVNPSPSGSTGETEKKGKINNQSGSGQGWSKPTTIFTNVTGEFCQVAFDKAGHVHIAAYDSSGNDLWYAYLSGYNDKTATKKTCPVDSYGVIGTQITLDVAYTKATGGVPVPYIGYLAEGKTLPKLAYYTGSDITSDSDIKGADGNFFTRNWEVSAVPSVTAGIQGVQGYDRINVGVWKSAGVLTDSKVDGEVKVSYYDNSGNEGNANSKGFVYGNGTSNPAMAYRYEVGQDGFVETAQKK